MGSNAISWKLPILPEISKKSVELYRSRSQTLIHAVNRALGERADLDDLIGVGALDIMETNHRNHAEFMCSVFFLNSAEMLHTTIPWVYQTYHLQGFSYDYFPIELKEWKIAVHQYLDGLDAEIQAWYDWMIASHETVIQLIEQPHEDSPDTPTPLIPAAEDILEKLFEGDFEGIEKKVSSWIFSPSETQRLYMDVLQPCLYEVGRLWQTGQISVAQEHLASSIIARIMAEQHGRWRPEKQLCKKAIITSSANEFHELGGWMVSDLLELDGWKVRYLGANTPPEDVLEMARSFRPDLLAVSVTMPFNLHRVGDLIGRFRNDPDLKNTKVMVGGQVFNNFPALWKKLQADGFAADADQARKLAATLTEKTSN